MNRLVADGCRWQRVAGSRGFSDRNADVMGGHWVDSREIRGLCFLYPGATPGHGLSVLRS